MSTSASPKPRMLTQPPTKDNQIVGSNMQSSAMNKVNSTILDEFKYGFPSDGLSSVSYRWWGNKSASDDSSKDDIQDDVATVEWKKNEADADNNQWAGLLSDLRKRAAKEGQQAIRLGVHRGYSVKSLDRTKKMALQQIFKSSLPGEWGDLSSDS